MNRHLNFFVPYKNAAAGHENQLTRALLVVLRYSPMAHSAWLRLAVPEMGLHQLPKADFDTQTQWVLRPEVEAVDGEAIRGISIWLAPDPEQSTQQVESHDRDQILDGVITYDNELVVVIETKINWGGWTDQPTRINLHGAPVLFDSTVRSVSWQHVLAALSDLMERELVSGAERLMVGDFLDLAEEHFPDIGPYTTLARCDSHRFRVERRLDAVLGGAVGGTESRGAGWRNLAGAGKMQMAQLLFADDGASVRLRMYAADTLRQSRAFYGDPPSVQSVLALQQSGWSVIPNFHWGFMATGYAWAETPRPVEQYCEYWIHEISSTNELGYKDWESYWRNLEAQQIVLPADKAEFDVNFTASKRTKATPRPGLVAEYGWFIAEATLMDSQGKFVNSVREKLNQMFGALNAPPIP